MYVNVRSPEKKKWTDPDGTDRVEYENGVQEIMREISPGRWKSMHVLPNNVVIVTDGGVNRIFYQRNAPSNYIEFRTASIAILPDLTVSVFIGNESVYTHRGFEKSLTLQYVGEIIIKPNPDVITFKVNWRGDVTLDTATGILKGEHFDPYEEAAKRQAERQAIRERDAKQEAAMWEELPEYKPQETTTPDLSPPKVTRNLYDIPEETDQELEDYHLGKEFGEIRI